MAMSVQFARAPSSSMPSSPVADVSEPETCLDDTAGWMVGRSPAAGAMVSPSANRVKKLVWADHNASKGNLRSEFSVNATASRCLTKVRSRIAPLELLGDRAAKARTRTQSWGAGQRSRGGASAGVDEAQETGASARASASDPSNRTTPDSFAKAASGKHNFPPLYEFSLVEDLATGSSIYRLRYSDKRKAMEIRGSKFLRQLLDNTVFGLPLLSVPFVDEALREALDQRCAIASSDEKAAQYRKASKRNRAVEAAFAVLLVVVFFSSLVVENEDLASEGGALMGLYCAIALVHAAIRSPDKLGKYVSGRHDMNAHSKAGAPSSPPASEPPLLSPPTPLPPPPLALHRTRANLRKRKRRGKEEEEEEEEAVITGMRVWSTRVCPRRQHAYTLSVQKCRPQVQGRATPGGGQEGEGVSRARGAVGARNTWGKGKREEESRRRSAAGAGQSRRRRSRPRTAALHLQHL